MPQRMLGNDNFRRSVFELISRYVDDQWAVGEPSMGRPRIVLLTSSITANVFKPKNPAVLKVGTEQQRGIAAGAYRER